MASTGLRKLGVVVHSGSQGARRGDASQVVTALRREIITGVQQSGSRLPSERRLAELHRCARGTIRRALDRLAAQGLIERRMGSGTFVVAIGKNGEDPADITSPDQLLETRRIVEPNLVRLAVRAATPRDIERLEEALTVLEACDNDIDRFGDGDLVFHERLAEATRNPLLIELYRRINRVRSHIHWREIQRQTLTPARIADYHRQHRELLSAIAMRDANKAERIAVTHLEEAERDLLSRPTKR